MRVVAALKETDKGEWAKVGLGIRRMIDTHTVNTRYIGRKDAQTEEKEEIASSPPVKGDMKE